MRTQLPRISLAASLLVLLASLGMLFVAARSFADARDARANAQRLYDARVEVARAQEELEGGDIEEALTSARAANETALRVGRLVARIADLLGPASERAESSIASARRGSSNALLARRHSELAAETLAAIASYQEASSRHSDNTNEALRRILRALRDTNREFPGRPLP